MSTNQDAEGSKVFPAHLGVYARYLPINAACFRVQAPWHLVNDGLRN